MAIARAFQSLNMNDAFVLGGEVNLHPVRMTHTGTTDAEIYHGSFTYSGDTLLGGTCTGIDYYAGGVKAYELTGGDWSAVTIKARLDTEDGRGLLRYLFAGADRVTGSAFADVLYAHGGNDVVRGGGGNDRLAGGDGHDRIGGGNGNDVIRGERGNDWIVGGLGADVLVGGDGADVFHFGDSVSGRDVITDFASGVDRVEMRLSGFDGLQAGRVSATSRETFRAGASLSRMDLNDRLFFNTTNRTLYYDRDGGGSVHAAVAVVRVGAGQSIAARDVFVVA